LQLREKAFQDAIWRDLGCYYDPTPDGLTMSQWVRSIAVRLDQDSRTTPLEG
jgi:hypothetical protein